MRQVVLLAFAAALAAPSVAAQSLGDAAAREKERRKAQKAGKVLTDDDLKRAGGAGNANVETGAVAAEAAPAASTAPGEAPAKKEKTEDELRAEQEKAWRDKLKRAEEDVQRHTARAAELQAALNDITGNLYGSQRAVLGTELEKAKAELQKAQQQVADLQEEGRRSRFRP